jgi:hypothetical protein
MGGFVGLRSNIQTDTFSLEFYRQMRAEDTKAYKARSQALNQVCTESIVGALLNLRDFKESLDSTPLSVLYEQEKADLLLAEFVNLAENGGASIIPQNLPSMLLSMMAENNKAALLVRALLDAADSTDDTRNDVQGGMAPGSSLRHSDSGIFVDE